eukprot:1161047-Pelagomonas_calceolata.AAC.17
MGAKFEATLSEVASLYCALYCCYAPLMSHFAFFPTMCYSCKVMSQMAEYEELRALERDDITLCIALLQMQSISRRTWNPSTLTRITTWP